MARKVYFALDYEHDLGRVQRIGTVQNIEPRFPAGLAGTAAWKQLEQQGEAAVKKAIDQALEGTTVTVIFIGAHTKERPYLTYEIEASQKRDNALVGIAIHHLPNEEGQADAQGRIPRLLRKSGFRTYKYFDRVKLREWIEESLEVAKELKRNPPNQEGDDSSGSCY